MSNLHKHPISGEEINGTRLPVGTKIQEEDVYDSTCGKWESNSYCVGKPVPAGDHVIWIRPDTVSSQIGTNPYVHDGLAEEIPL